MKKTKKKLITSLVAVVLLLLTVVGTTLAWFVDTTTPITNTFTVGNVDIALYETSTAKDTAPATEDAANALTTDYKNEYLKDNGLKILPTSKVDKYTYIVNYGDVNAYVGMTISVPTSLVDYLTLAIDNTKWTANKTYADGENTVFSYVYNTVLEPGKQTKELLSSITVKEEAGKEFVTALQNLEDTDEVSNDFSVVVIGYAIQEKGLEGVNSTVALNKEFGTIFDRIA